SGAPNPSLGTGVNTTALTTSLGTGWGNCLALIYRDKTNPAYIVRIVVYHVDATPGPLLRLAPNYGSGVNATPDTLIRSAVPGRSPNLTIVTSGRAGPGSSSCFGWVSANGFVMNLRVEERGGLPGSRNALATNNCCVVGSPRG